MKREMKRENRANINFRKISPLIISIMISGLISACGGSTVQRDPAQSSLPEEEPSYFNPISEWDPGEYDEEEEADLPALTTSFQMTGEDGETPNFSVPPVATDNLLKVKIKAEAGSNLSIPTYSGFTANYTCLSFKVSLFFETNDGWVKSSSVRTQTLRVGSNSWCPDSLEEDTIDFSAYLTSGHGRVGIFISEPKYDFYCKIAYSPAYYWLFYPINDNYCVTYPVYKNHTVNGRVDVQINGTGL